MKVLILFLVFAIGIQPLNAGFCNLDMGKSQPGQHQMDPSDHGGHDCCKSDGSDSNDGCDNAMNCGCFVHATAIPMVMKLVLTPEYSYSESFTTGLVLPSHSTPPFRPPIS